MHIPKKMLVVDVAPRDGLQSLPKWIPTDEKVWLCDRLTDLGVPVVEVASFAHPKVVPNMPYFAATFGCISTPAIGKPLPMPFAIVIRSGCTPAS